MALMVLDEARAGGVEDAGTSKANVFAYTAAISACGKAGQWEKAVSLLDVRKREEKRGETCCKQIVFELAVIVLQYIGHSHSCGRLWGAIVLEFVFMM